MGAWTEGYVTSVDYTYGYYREMAPHAMRFALHAGGYESPPDEGCTVCELAFGQGAGLALLAAANPGSGFWGNDFNPTHVAGARLMADETGLTNIDLSDASFAEMLDRDLPQFDWITLHGVWSWVGRENWAHIIEFARRRLKVGGALYVAYNAMPGWAALHPLRELLQRACAPGATSATTQRTRIDAALKMAERLMEVPTSHMVRTPQVKERLETLAAADRAYLAHEFLNRHWEPVYFGEMAELLSEAKLTWAAHGNPLHNIDAMCHHPALQKLLDEAPDPVLRETLRDIGLSTPFRRDLFVRGPRRLARDAQQQLLLGRDYVLQQPREQCPLTAGTPAGKVQLQPTTYEPLLDRLARGRTAGRELAALPGFAGADGVTRLLRALVVLVGLGYVTPCASVPAAERAQASVRRFNDRQLRRALAGAEEDFPWLASGATGSGLRMTRIEQFAAAMHRQHGGEPEAIVPLTVDAMLARGMLPVREGRTISDPAAARAELEQVVRLWAGQQRPLMAAHGLA